MVSCIGMSPSPAAADWCNILSLVAAGPILRIGCQEREGNDDTATVLLADEGAGREPPARISASVVAAVEPHSFGNSAPSKRSTGRWPDGTQLIAQADGSFWLGCASAD